MMAGVGDEYQQSSCSGDSGVDPRRKRCGFWLSKKGRYCSSPASPSSLYCGNHIPSSLDMRVPCPIDPSHTIRREAVALHAKICSATKQLKHFESQSYFVEGVNAGSDGEADFFDTADNNELNVAGISADGDSYESCGSKRAAIMGLSSGGFWDLIKRIEHAYDTCCKKAEQIILQPSECSKWWDPARDRRWPFQEKHVSQQASLLGNLEAFGLLQSENRRADTEGDELQEPIKNWVYVEFGAGRGYLGHMLCDSYGVSSVVLVERRAYKFKADRTLRQIPGFSMERLRVDIQDLNLQGVNSLQGRHYVAVSKHLCGPATDLTLRCCLNGGNSSSSILFDEKKDLSKPILQGIGIATCCHHLCQWRSYVNKHFFERLGFSMNDFNMITWLTSWAVNQTEEHANLDTENIVSQETCRQTDCEPSGSSHRSNLRISDHIDSLDLAARATIGRKCKYILDQGRLLWLNEHGMEAKIVEYISSTVTPENKLLLARSCNV